MEPTSYTIDELLRYNRSSTDAVARTLVAVIDDILNEFPTDVNSIEDMKRYFMSVDELESENSYLKDELEESENTTRQQRTQIDSLKFDLNSTLQVPIMKTLKAQIYDQDTKIKDLERRILFLERDLQAERDAHKYTAEKLHSWNILAT